MLITLKWGGGGGYYVNILLQQRQDFDALFEGGF